tara:strand:+ start:944 stop:1957 length:1014 start_codon:yes stop_codon:yes gene_type:complete
MEILRESYFANLSALTNDGSIVDIPNQALRKPASLGQQSQLNDNSIAIVSVYRFQDKAIEWSDKVKAICHPFKKTDMFPAEKKLYLLSESDFSDELISGSVEPVVKEYDIAYFTLDNRYGMMCKAFYIIPLLMPIATWNKLNVVIVNYSTREERKHEKASLGSYSERLKAVRSWIKDLKKEHKRVKFVNKRLSQARVSEIIAKSKFVMFPNNRDASPRLITESLMRGTPVLVNRDIYGGWKYVNETNGMFFHVPDDYRHAHSAQKKFYRRFWRAFSDMFSTSFEPNFIKEEYYKQYGLLNTAKRLAQIINEIEGDSRYKYVFYREHKNIFDNVKDLL